MNDKYDVKGRVHRLEQRKTWNIGLEHLPNRDSFDVEFSPSGQILRLATYSMAGVLIRSGHFVYSDSGKLSRSLEYDSTGRQTHSIDFVCRTEGNRIETTSETEGRLIGRRVWTFNDLVSDAPANRLTIYEYETDEAGNWVELESSPNRVAIQLGRRKLPPES